MRVRLHVFLLGVLLSISCFGLLYAKGLSVVPPSYKWQNVPVGVQARCPIKISVKNRSQKQEFFMLNVFTPAEINVEVQKGFKELPSKEWVSFSKQGISLLPGQTARIQMFIVCKPMELIVLVLAAFFHSQSAVPPATCPWKIVPSIPALQESSCPLN